MANSTLGERPLAGVRVVAFHDPELTGTVAYDGSGLPFVVGDGYRRDYAYADGVWLAAESGVPEGESYA